MHLPLNSLRNWLLTMARYPFTIRYITVPAGINGKIRMKIKGGIGPPGYRVLGRL
jgi:hypothetical protein